MLERFDGGFAFSNEVADIMGSAYDYNYQVGERNLRALNQFAAGIPYIPHATKLKVQCVRW